VTFSGAIHSQQIQFSLNAEWFTTLQEATCTSNQKRSNHVKGIGSTKASECTRAAPKEEYCQRLCKNMNWNQQRMPSFDSNRVWKTARRNDEINQMGSSAGGRLHSRSKQKSSPKSVRAPDERHHKVKRTKDTRKSYSKEN